MRAFVIALALPLILPAIASADEIRIDFPGVAVEEMHVSYECGTHILPVRYLNAAGTSLAVFNIDGERIVASAGPSGSGTRYVGGRYVWWTKGSEATLYDEMAGEDSPPLLTCAAT